MSQNNLPQVITCGLLSAACHHVLHMETLTQLSLLIWIRFTGRINSITKCYISLVQTISLGGHSYQSEYEH